MAVQPYENDSASDHANSDNDQDDFEYSNSQATDVTKNREREAAAACDRRPSGIVIHDGDDPVITKTDGPITVETPVKRKEPTVTEYESPPESSAQGAAMLAALFKRKVAEQAALFKRKAPECEADIAHKSKRQLILGTNEVLDSDRMNGKK